MAFFRLFDHSFEFYGTFYIENSHLSDIFYYFWLCPKRHYFFIQLRKRINGPKSRLSQKVSLYLILSSFNSFLLIGFILTTFFFVIRPILIINFIFELCHIQNKVLILETFSLFFFLIFIVT